MPSTGTSARKTNKKASISIPQKIKGLCEIIYSHVNVVFPDKDFINSPVLEY